MDNWKLPLLIDGNGKPSITALFAYISFIVTIGIVIYLTTKDAVAGSLGSLILFFGCLLIYRLRRLDSFSVDLDDKKISVNSEKESDKVKNDT